MRDKPRPKRPVAQQPLGEAVLAVGLMGCILLLDVLSNDAGRSAAAGRCKIGGRPQSAFPTYIHFLANAINGPVFYPFKK